MQGVLILLSAGKGEVGSLPSAWGAEESGRAFLLAVYFEDLGCTLPVLDFKLKWPGMSSRK